MGCLCDSEAESPENTGELRLRIVQHHYPQLHPLTENLLYVDRHRRLSERLRPDGMTAFEDDTGTGERH